MTAMILTALVLSALAADATAPDASGPRDVFANPVMPNGADPQAAFRDGEYFYVASDTRRLTLYRTRDITDLRRAKRMVIWDPPDGTDHSSNVWAPEIHFLNGKWYVYVAADDGDSDHHRMFVLENGSPDPFEGRFELKSRLKTDPNDNWAIDGTPFEVGGKPYFAWSGWAMPRVDVETACIWVAPMENPWTLGSPRVMLSQPEHSWERNWLNPKAWRNTPGHTVYVNEGPAVLQHEGRTFLTYSASGCWDAFLQSWPAGLRR